VPLLDRTRTLKERCARLQDLQNRIDETRKLDALLSELADRKSSLSKSRALATLLRSAGTQSDVPADVVTRNQARLARLQTRFAGNRKASTLTQGRDWSQLVQDLKELEATFEATAKAAWSSYVNGLYAGETTAAIRGKVAKTDENTQALREHEITYGEFLRIAGRLPETAEDIAAARSVADRLSAIRFDFNVPPAVKLFLDALSRGGAPLELLDNDVRTWLAANSQINRYQIVAVRS
jgi:hypothetical protein